MITRDAELPTAETMPRNDITVSRSRKLGDITTARLLMVLPKVFITPHRMPTVHK